MNSSSKVKKERQTGSQSEMDAKENALSALMLQLEHFAPMIPDAVTDYHLARGGLQTDDVRLKRLLALTAQKFISDIATDAMQYAKVRQQQAAQASAPSTSKTGTEGGSGSRSKIDKKTVLTMEDLSNAMQEHGVNIKKPEYYL